MRKPLLLLLVLPTFAICLTMPSRIVHSMPDQPTNQTSSDPRSLNLNKEFL